MSETLNEARIQEIAHRCHPVAAADRRVLGLYLFGSEAAGEAGEHSDVDLVNLGTCDPFLALQAIRGERIYEGDGMACDEFDLYVMRRAGDLEPFERERRRMVLEEGAGGGVVRGHR